MTAQPVERPHDAPLDSPATDAGATRAGGSRVDAIDALRGLVIVLMVLDHVRDFFHAAAFSGDAMALDSGNPALFLTRWATHLCAPTFVFLAGVSVWLQKAGGKSPADLSRFLVTRGLWLMALELAVIGPGFNFGWWIFLQVIWAIGFGMIVLAGLTRLPRGLVLALGVGIVLFHILLQQVPPATFGPFEAVWRALALRGPMVTPAGLLLVVYPAIPWLGLLLLGYGLGPVLVDRQGLRRGRVLALALSGLALFAVVRGLNVFGADPTPWSVQSDPLWTGFSVISVSKYPPSPAYVLLMLGLALLLLLAFDRLRGTGVRVLLTFGRTPLFTYLLHIWIAHTLALLAGLATGVPASAFLNSIVDPDRLIAAGWGFGLPAVYGFWALTLVILYPLSRWFEGVKRRRRDWWLGYL